MVSGFDGFILFFCCIRYSVFNPQVAIHWVIHVSMFPRCFFIFFSIFLVSCHSAIPIVRHVNIFCDPSFIDICRPSLSVPIIDRPNYRMPPAQFEIAASKLPKTIYPKHTPLVIFPSE